jgi:hypothetical protein
MRTSPIALRSGADHLPLNVLGLAGLTMRRSPWLATIGGGLVMAK